MTIKDVMTVSEAALRWKILPDSLKKACSGQKGGVSRFTPKECRKSGDRAWLVTRAGMERLYGKEPK